MIPMTTRPRLLQRLGLVVGRAWEVRLAAVFLLLIVLAAVLGPVLGEPAASTGDLTQIRQSPSAAHLLGTDDLGRDVLARVAVAAQTTIVLAVTAIAFAAAIGYAIGMLAALAPGWLATALRTLLDLWLAFPPLVIAIFISAVMRGSPTGVIFATAIAYMPQYARTMLNLVSGISGRDYVQVSRMLGVGTPRVLGRHVIPNVGGPLWIQSASGIGDAMVTMSALSFLGLGIPLPAYDWGSLLADNLDRIFRDPAVVLGPAIAITLVGIMFSFIGEAGALALDPQRWTASRTRRRAAPVAAEAAADHAAPSTAAMAAATDELVLDVEGLRVSYPADGGRRDVLHGISLRIGAGQVVGLVGESGSGKSTVAMAVADLLPSTARREAGRLVVAGGDVTGAALDRSTARVSVVFQDPMASLTPTMRIGSQLLEAMGRRGAASRAARNERALRSLADMRIADPERVFHSYPHELSGGMRQRVMLAIAMLREPRLLIADEPTTALDVTSQARILELIRSRVAHEGIGVLFVSHDLGVIREICDVVCVMRAGRIVEVLDVRDLDEAAHPYTRALLAAVPSVHLAPELANELRRERAALVQEGES